MMILKKNKEGQIIVNTKRQLKRLVRKTIDENGPNCDLNFLDISRVTDLSCLFSYSYDFSNFNGDISKWDTRNVEDMEGLFWNSKFNGDISRWNTGNVRNMSCMFRSSKFSGDISGWNTENVIDTTYMFKKSRFSGDISEWNVKNVMHMKSMFSYSPLESNPPSWYSIKRL